MRPRFLAFFALLACSSPHVRQGAADPVDSGLPDDPPPASDDEGQAVQPAVALLSPADGAEVDNPVTFTVWAEGVAAVALDADGYPLGEPWDPATEDARSYTFNGTGYTRIITLSGLDADGAVVASDQVSITVRGEGVLLDVPYFYQYDNRYEPGSTCGITSAAMLVDTWNPGSVTPDDLYVRYGKSQGQSPSSLAALYRAEGLYADWTTSGTRAEIRAQLDAGRPVVAHGWWTSAGHVVVIIGYDDEDWIVNDPAGDWSVCYGCGEGEAVRYPLGGDWDAAMSVDGDLWYSTAATAAF